MTVYYPGPRVRITDRAYEICNPRQVYAIRELYHVEVCTYHVGTAAEAWPSVRGGCIGSGVVAMIFPFTMPGWPGQLLGAGVIVIAAGIGTCCWLARARAYEIRAYHRGRYVCLLRTDDPVEFGQVRRALSRALNRRDDDRF